LHNVSISEKYFAMWERNAKNLIVALQTENVFFKGSQLIMLIKVLILVCEILRKNVLTNAWLSGITDNSTTGL
jgi:hypothetical protein